MRALEQLQPPATVYLRVALAADTVHDGRNEGSEPVELLVTYILPAGQPRAVPAPQPSAAASAGGGASCQR